MRSIGRGRRPDMASPKERIAAKLRKVPIGHAVLIEFDWTISVKRRGFTLYERTGSNALVCRAAADGTCYPFGSIAPMRIDQPSFSGDSKIHLLSDQESARRLMLWTMGLGSRAIEPVRSPDANEGEG